ncbi:MAG: hypothetical protein ACTHO8_08190 [Solirubrobacterales bacterium]
MPTFSVRFKGLLSGTDRARLEEAGIVIESSKPSLRVGLIRTGRSIHTAAVEADSGEEALAKAREALAPDDVNFSDWKAGPTRVSRIREDRQRLCGGPGRPTPLLNACGQ